MNGQTQPPQPQQQPEKPRGLLGFLGDPDRRARLAIALEGMTLNPNQAFIGTLQEGIKTRAGEKQRNATVEWLRSKGRADLAEAIAAGGLPAAEAVRMAMTPRQGPEQTALMQNVQWLMSQGMTMDRALEVARGGTTVNVGTQDQPRPELLGTQGLVAIPDPNSPTGYRVEPAPGSPIAVERAKMEREEMEAAKKTATGEGRKELYKSETVRAAEKAIQLMGKKGAADVMPEAGRWGAFLADSFIPLPGSQEATDLKATLGAVQAGIAFDRLQAMRDASATGGALGSVTERELTLLMSSLGAISQEISPALLKENLQNIVNIMTKIENDPVARAAYGGSMSAPSAAAPAAPAASVGGFAGMSARDLAKVDVTKLSLPELEAFMKRMQEVGQ